MKESLKYGATPTRVPSDAASRWPDSVRVSVDARRNLCSIECEADVLADVCAWLFTEAGYTFAGLIVEEHDAEWHLRYVFYGDGENGQVQVLHRRSRMEGPVPTISHVVHAADWHEREAEDLFGLVFEGHPRLGGFVLHEEWPEGVNPMRKDFDAARPYTHREVDPEWRPVTIVETPGAFTMPIGPVYSDFAESAHFLLETVGEDVIRTIPRFFYKYRGIEKIAEGKMISDVLLLTERFSGTSAFAHSLAFCQAVEEVSGVEVPRRAKVLRVLLAELERLRHHVGAIGAICASTALAVATSQAHILEEVLLRASCDLTGHRYLFGLNTPGGLTKDLGNKTLVEKVSGLVYDVAKDLKRLKLMLKFSSSFLDRLEEVGIVSNEQAAAYGLVGPIARASGISMDLRKALPYCDYEKTEFTVPAETEGDGYARLRILFDEAEQSARIIQQMAMSLPTGPVACAPFKIGSGASLGWAEAPRGATFHWLRCESDGCVARYRLMTPSFTNWHGFHLAAEDFAFQDFPIIMATFGLSNAESDR
jgi:Ni,Fe-hydrogenase III large subunit/NADH:ubiquinone oxidoreductase subunit C